MMTDLASKKQLAQEVLAFGAQLAATGASLRPGSKSGSPRGARPTH
jgi:hypothetical protein